MLKVSQKPVQSVYIIGMGALGMLFGGTIEDHLGRGSISFLMDDERYQRHASDTPPTINGAAHPFRLTRASEAEPCDFVIVATKATGLDDALISMEKAVGPDTTIISILNGISSEGVISGKFGTEKVIHCVAQGMDAVCFGNTLTYKVPGMLCVGIAGFLPEETKAVLRGRLDALVDFFERAGVPFKVEEDIIRRQWSKFMLNCGCNQTCMVYNTNYAGMMEPGSEAFMAMTAAMREVVALAQLEGISLGEKDLAEYLDLMRTLDPESMPSMAQDRIRRKKSEVEIFAGTVRRLAAKHGIEVPAADYLYRRIHEIEASY